MCVHDGLSDTMDQTGGYSPTSGTCCLGIAWGASPTSCFQTHCVYIALSIKQLYCFQMFIENSMGRLLWGVFLVDFYSKLQMVQLNFAG